MVLEPIKPEVLAVRMIPNVDPQLAARLSLDPVRHRSLGMITCSSDDALYAALDEGTKAADADVVYAKSFYAGSAHASGPFSGEIIGMFAGPDEETVSSAVQATLRYLEAKAWFFAADDAGRLAFFPHVLPSLGRYLSRQAGVEPGTPMAYLIAPPIEATLGLDAALKAARVELKVHYPPPSETNFSGGLLVGDLPEVEAAARAFQATVLDLAARPRLLTPLPELECLAESFGKVAHRRGAAAVAPKRYRLWGSGLDVDEKPAGYTHLFDDRSLVPKTHPAIRFRGRLDLLQAQVLEAQLAATQEGHSGVARDLDDVLRWLRGAMASEVVGRPMPELAVSGLTAEDLHRVSHDTVKYLGVGWVVPDASMGATAVRLNLLRATCRDVEIAAFDAFGQGGHLSPETRDALLHGLNRLSNVLYVLVCKVVGVVKSRPPATEG
ncbi:MAG: ethanolamine utilization microcompartment protein EutL [Deltaproteobacteria bacterium]|nr:ethanolamine utilization microcompartment protein EutL [Deltaproteobacteria bacterium]